MNESEITKNLKALQSSAAIAASQHVDALGQMALTRMVSQWHETQERQMDYVRKALDPLADIRADILQGGLAHHVLKNKVGGVRIRDHMKDFLDQIAASGLALGVADGLMAEEAANAQTQVRSLVESLDDTRFVDSYLDDFARVNKQWSIPDEVLGLVGALKDIHAQFGAVTLPTIGWSSAAALASILGRDGIEEQLALVGIESDGSVLSVSDPETGILSRKQLDVLALFSLLLTFVIFLYQQQENSQQQLEADVFQARTSSQLQAQNRQIQTLTALIEETLQQAARMPEERFVVRERMATVRAFPQHGSSVEGGLFPKEAVRSIGRNGRWVQVEYYHWLGNEYRKGWVLKKYLERVPVKRTERRNE